jgi:hypothetical protein
MANAPPIPELVPIPDGYRRIAREEVTPAMLNFARIAESNKLPIGKLQSSLIEGQHIAALTDWHYSNHRNRNGRKHWHPAISLLVQKGFVQRPATPPFQLRPSSTPQWSADNRPPPPPPGPLQSGNSPGPLQSGDSPGPLQAQATVTASASSPALSQIASVVKAAPAIVSTAKSAVNALSDLNLSGSIDVSADMDLTENLDAAGDSDVETAAEFGGGKRPRKRHR